jgi:hypothetical protein
MLLYKTIETYQCSQDFIECFLGIIRSRLGGNNNPTALDFKYALRRILHRNQLQGNKFSNVKPVGIAMDSLFSLVPVKKLFVGKSFVKEVQPDLVHKDVLIALSAKYPKNSTNQLANHAIFFSRIIQKIHIRFK